MLSEWALLFFLSLHQTVPDLFCVLSDQLSSKKCALRLFYMKLECCFSSEVNRKDLEPNKTGSAHFKEEDKDRTSLSCTRIHKGAVPSIFLNIVKVTEPVNVKRKLTQPFIASPVRISIVTEKIKTFSNVEQNLMFPYNSK